MCPFFSHHYNAHYCLILFFHDFFTLKAFLQIAIETAGGFGHESGTFLTALGHQIMQATGEERSKAALLVPVSLSSCADGQCSIHNGHNEVWRTLSDQLTYCFILLLLLLVVLFLIRCSYHSLTLPYEEQFAVVFVFITTC